MHDDKRLHNLKENARRFLKNDEFERARLQELIAGKIDLQVFDEPAGWRNLLFTPEGSHVRYHRERDPFSELSEQLTFNSQPELAVCCGTGFGYQWMKAAPLLQDVREIIIVEPLFEALFVFLTEHDLSMFLPGHASILYIPDSEVLSRYLQRRVNRYHPTNVIFTSLESIAALSPGLLRQAADRLEGNWRRHQVFLRSLEDQFEEITTNVRENMISSDAESTLCINGHQAERCIVLGSGPSLDEILNSLPLLKDSVSIIAAGSAAAVLKRHGIQPDVTVISDPQRYNALHFREQHFEPLIYDPVIASEIPEHFSGDRILITVGHAITELFAKILGITSLECWGTITSTALAVARNAGFGEIAMCGMEFSFRAGKAHANNYALQGIRGAGVETTDIFDRPVFTTSSMERYAEYVEGQVQHYQQHGVRMINLMEGGLIRAGENISVHEYLTCQERIAQPKKSGNWAAGLKTDEKLPRIEEDYFDREWCSELGLLKTCDGQNVMLTDVFRNKMFAALEGGCLQEAKQLESRLINGGDVEGARRQLNDRLQVLKNELLDPLLRELQERLLKT